MFAFAISRTRQTWKVTLMDGSPTVWIGDTPAEGVAFQANEGLCPDVWDAEFWETLVMVLDTEESR